MVDLNAITPAGMCFLLTVVYILGLIGIFISFRWYYRKAFKAYTDALFAEYTRALAKVAHDGCKCSKS